MSTFQVISQRPVMREQRLGSIPKDAYVLNQGLQPNLAPLAETVPGDLFEVKDGQDVRAMVPARNQDGSLQIQSETTTLTAEPHNPVRFAMLASGLAAASGAGLGAALGGVYGAVVGGVVSGLAGGILGTLSAKADEVSIVTREAQVTEPVLTGYRMGAVDGAYVAEKPGHW